MLTEPILMLQLERDVVPATLPDALARLCDGTLIAFDGLAAHQRHAWDLFLYQIAALALRASGEAEAAENDAAWRGLADAQGWRRRLAALTPGCADTAWSLAVDDLTKPAFMQPPIASGTLAGYTIAGQTPDEIDVLVTSKGHDVKAARAASARPLHWVFALVTLQTLQGYSGRGNFGIARMNGGFASRPLVMLTPGRDLPVRFRRGVQVALNARRTALSENNYRADGLAVLWLKPWDAEESLPLNTLDPLFVEVCRRLRLVTGEDGGITAWGRPSEAPRVGVAKEALGNTGDAWTPIAAKEGAALTVGAGGFDYRLVSRLLTPKEFHRPAAMEPTEAAPDGGFWLHAAVLARGQGKTEGLHERWLLIPQVVEDMFRDPAKAELIARMSGGMIEQAKAAATALRTALLKYLQGGIEKIDFGDKSPGFWLDLLNQRVDGIFFDHLFARLASGGDLATETAWRAALVELTRDLFRTATARLSAPECRRERALALGWNVLDGMLWKAELPVPRSRSDERPDTDEEEAA